MQVFFFVDSMLEFEGDADRDGFEILRFKEDRDGNVPTRRISDGEFQAMPRKVLSEFAFFLNEEVAVEGDEKGYEILSSIPDKLGNVLVRRISDGEYSAISKELFVSRATLSRTMTAEAFSHLSALRKMLMDQVDVAADKVHNFIHKKVDV